MGQKSEYEKMQDILDIEKTFYFPRIELSTCL